MSESIELKIPDHKIEEAVHSHIHAAVIRALTANQDKYLDALVRTALKEKQVYGYRDVLQHAAQEMVRDAAKDAIKEWVEANKSKVGAAIKKRLEAGVLADRIGDAVCDAMQSSFYVSISLRTEESA